jgi:hypothetical protein
MNLGFLRSNFSNYNTYLFSQRGGHMGRNMHGAWSVFNSNYLSSHVSQYTPSELYAELLQGAPPPILLNSCICTHRQIWKLREHHFVMGNGPSATPADDKTDPLSAGDPLRAYFPTGTHIVETHEGLEVCEPSRRTELRYRRAAPRSRSAAAKESSSNVEEQLPAQVQDIIITGEVSFIFTQYISRQLAEKMIPGAFCMGCVSCLPYQYLTLNESQANSTLWDEARIPPVCLLHNVDLPASPSLRRLH